MNTLRILTLVGAALLFQACAPQDNGTPPPGQTDLTPVRIGYLRIGSDLPFFVGEELGIFEAHGLDVEGVRLGTSNLAKDALFSGAVDATDIIGSSVVFDGALEDPDLFQVFMAAAATGDANIHQLVVRPGAGINDPSDLRGKRLAVFPGSQMRVYARLFLSEYLPQELIDTVELVPLAPPQQRDALADGQVDAVLALEPTGTLLRADSLGTLLLGNVLYESISRPRPFVTSFATIRSDWAARNPAAANALVAAYREISQIIRDRPAEVKQILARRLEIDPAVASEVSLYDYPVTDEIDLADIRATAQLMVAHDALPSVPDLRRLIYQGGSWTAPVSTPEPAEAEGAMVPSR